jgi:peptide/nickel transport system permease protein
MQRKSQKEPGTAAVATMPEPQMKQMNRIVVPRTRAVMVHPLLAFVLRRLLQLVIVLFGLVIASFLMVRLIPGNPAVIIASENTGATIPQIEHALGLDKPLVAQFGSYVAGLFHGNLGASFQSGEPVSTILSQNAGPSLQLAAVSVVLVLVVSIVGGLALAGFTRDDRHKRGELAFTGVSSVVGSVPEYLTATFLAFIFALLLRWLPVAGTNGVPSLVLPVLAISLRPIAILMRIVRVETLNVLASDYVRTARSKHLPSHSLYIRHVMPNVLTAVLTLGGLLFAGVIGSAVVVEQVFGRLGLGTTLVTAVINRDYPVVQGCILALGAMVVVINAAVDITLAFVDPRSTVERRG